MEEKKVKILLIESNTSARFFFTDIFWLHSMDSKFELYVADGVASAEKFLTDPARTPDMVFLDLVMGQKTDDGLNKTSPEVGLNFISRIKKDPALAHTKIIIYSSYPKGQYGAAAKERGADMYIYKSENLPQDILTILNDLHRQHAEAINPAPATVAAPAV